MSNLPFDQNICHSIKNKKQRGIQCTNQKVENENLCKIHLKNKYREYYVQLLDKEKISDVCISCEDVNTKEPKEIKETRETVEKTVYEREEFLNLFLTNLGNNLTVGLIRNNIKLLGLSVYTKLSKPELIKDLRHIAVTENNYKTNIDKIVLIQSFIRRWLIMRRFGCCNPNEITSFDEVIDIPGNYFYLFKDTITGKKFGYDIRSLIAILKSDYPTCPYTFRQFTDDEKTAIHNHFNKLKNAGIELDFEKNIMTKEQEMEMRMKDVFHKINMLDNYTSHTWFLNLSLKDLMDLYATLEDIWNYRLGMTPEAKNNILPSTNGTAFLMSNNTIRRIKSKEHMQNILLTEINKFVSDGINRDERKLGAMLILTGLVEISEQAADALPHLIVY
jgi:hypothetical protein